MNTPNGDIQGVLESLEGPGTSIEELDPTTSRHPGIYAVHADAKGWAELGLGVPPDERPVYVGKAERSLAARQVAGHFGMKPRSARSPTGSSTLRRSLATLLADDLGFVGVPRNPASPGHFSNFGLTDAQDTELSGWMKDRLKVAIWPHQESKQLDHIETQILAVLLPPLNLSKITTPWTASTKAARKVLATQAEEWHPA